MAKKEENEKLYNIQRLENLESQFKEIIEKRNELQSQLNELTTLGVKLQGAIEILQSIENENKGDKE